MSLPQPQCDRCQSPLAAPGRCANCAPLTSLTGARPRSVDPGKPPTPSAPDDNWDVVLSDAPGRRSLESMPGEEGLGTLAFERVPDGSIRPIAREPAPAPEPPPPPRPRATGSPSASSAPRARSPSRRRASSPSRRPTSSLRAARRA